MKRASVLSLALACASCSPLVAVRGLRMLRAGIAAVDAGVNAWHERHGASCDVDAAAREAHDAREVCAAIETREACGHAVDAYARARELLARAPEGGAEGEGGAWPDAGPEPAAVRAAMGLLR